MDQDLSVGLAPEIEAGSELDAIAVEFGSGLARTCRSLQPLASVDDLWRRAGVPVSSLVRIAEADAMREALGLARREALWANKALRDEPLELFAAAAERERRTVPEIVETEVALCPMTSGSEVVKDYRHVGLSLRRHPVTFLRDDLATRRHAPCRPS